MRFRMMGALVIVATVAMLAGCGGGSDGTEDHGGPTDSSSVDTRPDDVSIIIPTDTPDRGPGELEDGEDDPGAQKDTPPSDAPRDIPAGATGAPCTHNEDCDSRFCLEGPEGLECAGICSTGESCNPGYACIQVSPPPDLIFACVYTAPRLCFPCSVDEDCRAGAAPTQSACVDYGSAGRFCGATCTRDQDCVQDYQCKDVTTASGTPTKQCVPVSGECGCPRGVIEGGLSTPCFRENAIGKCTGLRTCNQDGLSTCDAPTPGVEVCDGRDNDCNGGTDDVVPIACQIKNTYGACPGTLACEGGKDKCDGVPPAAEQCNGIDDDCNGTTDDQDATGCRTYYKDVDADTHGDPTFPACLCAPKSPYTTAVGDDCDDFNAYVYTGAVEACNGRDDNCDGQTDEPGAAGCKTFFRDQDLDKYGVTTDSQCLCASKAPYTAALSGDCVDTDATVHPGAPEVCNGKDDNCDGKTDPESATGCVLHYYDGDGDQYGDDLVAARCLCAKDLPNKYTTTFGGDCSDADATVNPKAQEVCNGKDDNCNGQTDEPGSVGCSQHWADQDGDTWGSGSPVCTCTGAPPYTAVRGDDCDDGNSGIHPTAPELCNKLDDGCNGLTDEENAESCKVFYYDQDKDGYGTDSSKCLCEATGFFTAKVAGDCAPNDAARNPGAAEQCANYLDDDCDGQTDEGGSGCVTFYADRDGDGAGDPKDSQCLCSPKAPYTVQNKLDCNDASNLISPSVAENCGTKGVDDNCNGVTDEEGADNCATYYQDKDGDQYGSSLAATRCLCQPDATTYYVSLVGGDCNDNNAQINPSKQEECDGIDNDCDKTIDEMDAIGCTPYYYDGDGDKHGDRLKPSQCLCGPNAGTKYSSQVNDDCNDTDPTISVGLPEVCGDGKDNDCNGKTDEGGVNCKNYYMDLDGDTYGDTRYFQCLCAPDTLLHYTALVSGDCDDGDALAHPGGIECGKDGDCDGYLADAGEECDDGNGVLWDGCTFCLLSEMRINRNVSGDQTRPDVAALPDGTYAVLFQGYFPTPQNEIVLRRILADGSLSADDAVVNSYTTGNQYSPSVAAFPGGGFVVVWESVNQDGGGLGVYGQQYDSTITKKGGEFQVNGTTLLDQYAPQVATTSTGTFVVTWQSLNQDGGGLGVYARVLDASAVPSTAEIRVNTTTALDQDSPVITTLPGGAFAVAWRTLMDRGGSVTDREIRHRVFAADGTPSTAELVTNVYTTSDQQAPAIAPLGANGFVVVWHSTGQDSSGLGIYGRRFNNDGTAKDLQDVPIATSVSGDQFGPAVGSSVDGKYTVAWSSMSQDGSGLGVYYQRFDAFGNYYGAETIANVYTTGDQTLPAIAAQAGNWVLVWTSMNQDSNLNGIFGRRYNW